MNLSDVMEELASRADHHDGLRAFAFPVKAINPPTVIVAYPQNYTFDATYGRGMDKMKLRLIVAIGNVTERTTRTRLGAYCDGAGTSSLKAHLQSGAYTSFDMVRVASIDFDVITIAGADYMGAIFNLDIVGKGMR